ncbi:MAG: hypothetical protein C4583_15145 [Anaerolineaceae bacterium]|nr:MAG: hypothetical protein C4583_15145 [Anaerolineaceae bacterium]
MTAFGFAGSIAVTFLVRFATDFLAGAAFAGVFPFGDDVLATGLLAFALLTGFFAATVFLATGFFALTDVFATVFFAAVTFLATTFFFVTFFSLEDDFGVAFFLVVFFFAVAILTSLKISFRFQVPGVRPIDL